MNHQDTLSGGCACGAVRFQCTATAEQRQTFKCHCRDCQLVTGAPFVAAVFVPVDTFRFTRGRPKFHSTPSAAGGRHLRGFCAECGTRLTGGQAEGETPTHIGFTAASLDDPSWYRAQCEIWTQDAQPWDPLDPAIPHFPQYPPA